MRHLITLLFLSMVVVCQTCLADQPTRALTIPEWHFKIDLPDSLQLIRPAERQVPVVARVDNAYPLVMVSVHPGSYNQAGDLESIKGGIKRYLEHYGQKVKSIESTPDADKRLLLTVLHSEGSTELESRILFVPWRKQLHYVLRYTDTTKAFSNTYFDKLVTGFEVLPAEQARRGMKSRDRALFIFVGIYGFTCFAVLALHQSGRLRNWRMRPSAL